MKLATLALVLTAACTQQTEDLGLVLDVNEAHRVAGTFERAGVALAFDFARDGRRHTSEFRDADGHVLLVTELEGREQVTRVLGDRLVITGLVNAPDPSIEGDLATYDELGARPETTLLEGLHDGFVAEGIDADLYSPQPDATSNIYDGGDGYFYFGPGESKVWSTAAGLRPTFVELVNHNDICAVIGLYPGLGAETRMVDAYGYDYTGARYWWGALLRVKNFGAWIQWGDQVCGPTTVGVRVSYNW